MALHKPGEIITPASFAVAPELLGLPLATPARRGAAMAIDLLLLGILVKGGAVFFGLAGAFALWRASARAGQATRRPRLRRNLRIAAAALLFLIVVGNWGFLTRPLRRAEHGADRPPIGHDIALVAGNGTTHVNTLGIGAIAQAIALRNAATDADARRRADALVRRLRRNGMADRDLRELTRGLAEAEDSPLPPRALKALQEAVAAQLPGDDDAPPGRADSLAGAYFRAGTSGDSAALERLQPRLVAVLAHDTLENLNATVGELRADNRKLNERIREDSARRAGGAVGLMDTFANAGDEIIRLLKKAGLGFGWTGLYFTAFVALMRGQTPGKRLLRIRIVRLDGRSMGWWSALERFGGYAASLVTGLSGFFQILWDKNRQAMHDKIAETVVVRV